MKPNFVKLDSDLHKGLAIRSTNDYAHVRDENLAPLTMHEFVQIAAAMPVVFIPTGQGDQLQPVAMMGLEQGENLFMKNSEKWQGIAMPESVTIYPFGLVPDENEETGMAVSFDENSDRFAADGDRQIFTGDGAETEFFVEAKAFVMRHFENMQKTRGLTQYFQEKGLLKPFGVALNRGEGQQPYTVEGFHVFDEAKLNELPIEELDEFRKRGLLPGIYAQLCSLQQFNNLARLKFAE